MARIIFPLLIVLANAVSGYAQDHIDKTLLMDYFQEQQYDKVIQYLEETVKPQEAYGLGLLANAYYQNGQFPQAEKYYKIVLEKDSNHVQAHQHLGNIAKQQQQLIVAFEHYEKLVTLRPANAAYYKQLSRVCENIVGMQDTAFYFLQRSYQLNPKDVSVVTSMAAELMIQKKNKVADSILKTYYAMDSSQVTVIAQLVKLSFFEKKYADAAVYGEHLLSTNTVDPTACIYLAAAYLQMKKYDSCIRVHDRMITIAQAAPEAVMYYAAVAYAELRQYDRSNQMFEACIKMAKSQNLDSYYAGMADNFEQMKQYKNAIAHYDTAYYLFKNPMRLYGIGRIYDQSLQDPQRAKRHYQQYLKVAKPESKNETSIHAYVKERIKTL